ncbi:DAO domain-containing protein [Caerostris darwini]|uniref:DAO domain-containing protein n=1 Tax=Caerostris darwini TaxID=1538125 RepID=A0AAV4UFW3_9ARAC|nr:DAO domain-containing protein [Caerostris darwini]
MFGSSAARHASANPSIKVCLVGPSEPTDEELSQREIFGSHYDEGRITRVLDNSPACQILSKHAIRRYKELEKLSGIT